MAGATIALSLTIGTPVLAQSQPEPRPGPQSPPKAPSGPTSLLPPGAEPAPVRPAPLPLPLPQAPGSPTAGETPSGQAADTSDVAAPSQLPNVRQPMIRPLPSAAPDLLSVRRIEKSTSGIGWLQPDQGGLSRDTWRGTSPQTAQRLLMRREGPVASRWLHTLLRRTLVSGTDAPTGLSAGDFSAAQAYRLLRMGEAVSAKGLIDRTPTSAYTELTYMIATQAQLAAGDLLALCPFAATGRSLFSDPIWPLLDAVCTASSGDGLRAAVELDDLRENAKVIPFDVQLADRVATAVSGGNRGVNVEWPAQIGLTSYRLGMGLAGRVAFAPNQLAQVNDTAKGWLARHPDTPEADRLLASDVAALNGSLTLSDWVGQWSAISTDPAISGRNASRASALRTAFAAARVEDRLTALRSIWADGKTPRQRLSRLLLTSRAAALIPAGNDTQTDQHDLVRALALGGEERAATAWAASVAAGETPHIWPMIAAMDGSRTVPVNDDLFQSWLETRPEDTQEADGTLVGAILAGLGRLDAGNASDVSQIADAVERAEAQKISSLAQPLVRLATSPQSIGRQISRGEVVLRAGLALTAGKDGGVNASAQTIRTVLQALRAAGFTTEARLIGAELMVRTGL